MSKKSKEVVTIYIDENDLTNEEAGDIGRFVQEEGVRWLNDESGFLRIRFVGDLRRPCR